jgi:hypothetical protein
MSKKIAYAGAGREIDHVGRDGAYRLARRIEQHWREHGYLVEARVEREEPGLFIVRSNLRNGLPAHGGFPT